MAFIWACRCFRLFRWLCSCWRRASSYCVRCAQGMGNLAWICACCARCASCEAQAARSAQPVVFHADAHRCPEVGKNTQGAQTTK